VYLPSQVRKCISFRTAEGDPVMPIVNAEKKCVVGAVYELEPEDSLDGLAQRFDSVGLDAHIAKTVQMC